jgi:soluble lytic murein transglycosylase
MTPPAATVSRSRSHARRRAAGRRRRVVVGTVAFVGIVALAIALAMPLFKKAVNEIDGLPLSYSDVIRQQAAEKHLDPALIAAVIYAETKFDPRPSSAGAEGLMQILPRTAEFLARRSGATTFTVADLATPSVNIAYGSYYLRYLLDRYNNQEMLALAAYNGGETNVDQWLARARRAGRPLSIDQIPFPQTRAYVLKVLQAQRDYRHTYPTQLGYS